MMKVSKIIIPYIRIFVFVVCISMVYFLQTDLGRSLIHSITHGDVLESNLAYLTEREKSANDDLVKLGAIYAAFEVLESSDIGVDFIFKADVKLGKLIADITNILEKALDALMLASFVTIVIKMTLPLVASFSKVIIIILAISFSVFVVLQPFKRFRRISRLSLHIGIASLQAFIIAQFVIPYTVKIAAELSNIVLDDVKQENYAYLNELERAHHRAAQATDITARTKNILHHLHHSLRDIPAERHDLNRFLMRHNAILFFEVFFFPCFIFSVFAIAYYILKHKSI